MAKSKKDPYAAQAQAAATVRYGPELSALTALLAAADQSYSDRVRQAKSSRQFGVGAVDAALPRVAQAYQGAQTAVQPAFAQGGGVEAQALQARLGESGALAQSQLQARRVSAIEGEGAARDQALRDLRTDRGKIGDRSTDLAREIGAFQTQTAGELGAADAAALAGQTELAARLGQQERNSIRSSGIDPDTGQPIPGGKLDPKTKTKPGEKWASQEAQSATADEIQRLLKQANDFKTQGESRSDVADLLLTGIPASEKKQQVVYETVNGKRQPKLNKDGTQVTKEVPADPGVKQAKSQLLLAAALDVAYDGHLSRRTQKLLHERRIQLEPLGVATFGEWLKSPEGQEWKRRQRGAGTHPGTVKAPSSVPGQSRPT